MTPNINNFNPNMSLQEYKAPTPLDLPVPQYVPLSTPTIYDPPKFDIPSLNTNVGGNGKKGDGWDIDGFMRDLKTDRLTSNVAFNTSGFASQTGFGAIGSDYGKMTLEGKSQRFEDLYDFNSDGKGVKKFKNFYDPSTDEDRLARQQGAFEKTLNGIIKMQNTVATTVARGTVGAVYGLGSSLANWDLSKMYDNSLQQALGDWDMEVRSALANYRTNEEKQRSFLGKMATVNFWADDFLQGVGYIGGIALTHYLTGGIGSRFSVALRGTTAGANPSLLASLGTRLGAVSNNATASMLAGASKDVLKTLVISGATEGATTALQFRNDAIDDYINKSITKNGTVDQEAFKEYVNDVTKLGNGVFATTSAISAASDLVQFGKILGISKGLSKVGNKLGINQIVNKFGLGTGMNKTSSKFIKEGFEKGGQEALDRFLTLDATQAYSRGWKGKVLEHVVDKGVKMGAEALEEGGAGIAENMAWSALHNMYDVDNLYKTTNEIEGNFAGFFDLENFKDATEQQFSTPEGRHEMYMGALLGLVGGGIMRAGSGDFKGAISEIANTSYSEARRNRATALAEMQSVLKNDIERGMTSDNFGAVANSYVERIKRLSAFNAQVDKANEFRDKGDMFMADLLDSSASFDQMMMLSDKVFGGNSALDKSVQNLFNARVDALDNNALRIEHGLNTDAEVQALKDSYKENFVKRQTRMDKAVKYAADYAQLLNQDENSSLIDVLARQRYLYDTALESKKTFGDRISNSLNIVRGQEFQNVLENVIKGYDKLGERIVSLREKRSAIESEIKVLQESRIKEIVKKGDVKNTKKGVEENAEIRDLQDQYNTLQQDLLALEAEEKQLEAEYNRTVAVKNAVEVDNNSESQGEGNRGLRADLSFTEIAKLYEDVNNLGDIAEGLRNTEGYEEVGKDFLNTLEAYTNSINAVDSMERFFDDIEKASDTKGVVPKIVQKIADFFGKETKDRSDRQDRGKQAYTDENRNEVKSEEDQFVEDLVEDVINSLPTEKAKKKARANAEMIAVTKALVRLQYRTRFNKQAQVEQQNYNFLNALYERDPLETVTDEELEIYAKDSVFVKEEVVNEETGEGTGEYVYNIKPEMQRVVDSIVSKLTNKERLTLRERKIYEGLKEQDKDFFDTFINKTLKSEKNGVVSLDSFIEEETNKQSLNEPVSVEGESLFEEVSRRVAQKLAEVSKQTDVSEDDVLDTLKDASEEEQNSQDENAKPKTKLQQDIANYKELSNKETLTEEEQQQLEDLEQRLSVIDAAYNTEEGSTLKEDLDLLNQLSMQSELDNRPSTDYTPETISDSEGKPFADEEGSGGRSAAHAQNYSNAFMTIERDEDDNTFINISNLSLKGFLNRLVYDKITVTKKGVKTDLKTVDAIKPDDNVIYTVVTMGGSYNFKYNKHGNILLEAEDRNVLENLKNETGLDLTLLQSNKFSNYSPLYEIDEVGNYHPVSSDIEVEVKDGENYKIDQQAVKELKAGDEVFVIYPTNAIYNKRRTKEETSVKEDVLLLGDSKGRIVGVVKAGHGSTGQYENLIKLRNEAVTRVRNGETNRIFNGNPNLIDTGFFVVVNRVENGHPNVQLTRDEGGNVTNHRFSIPSKTAKNVKVLGFGIFDARKAENDSSKYEPVVLNKSVKDLSLTRDSFRFVDGVAKSTKNGVVSYVMLEYNGRNVAYPVTITPSTETTLAETLVKIASNKKVNLTARAKMVNDILTEQGYDTIKDAKYKHLFATKDNVGRQEYIDGILNDLSVPVEFMGNSTMSILNFEELKKGTELNLNLADENLFFAPKFSMDLENVMDSGAVKVEVTKTVEKQKKTSKKEERKPEEEPKSVDDFSISALLSLQSNIAQKKWVRDLGKKFGFARLLADTRVKDKIHDMDIINYIFYKLGEDTPRNKTMIEHYRKTYLEPFDVKGKSLADIIDGLIDSEAGVSNVDNTTNVNNEVTPTETVIVDELFPETLFPETGSSEKISTKKMETKKDTTKSKKTTTSNKDAKKNCK
jgi:hypothetical protein|nr:MAG TPA: Structural protein [Caudoviricetes sp.]